MKPQLLGWVSPRAHRRIDLLTFPSLVAAAAVLARRDRRAAGVVLATAAVEGLATATTNYPPPVIASAIVFARTISGPRRTGCSSRRWPHGCRASPRSADARWPCCRSCR